MSYIKTSKLRLYKNNEVFLFPLLLTILIFELYLCNFVLLLALFLMFLIF